MRALFLVLFSVLVSNTVIAAQLGEDGLHKQDWFSISFRDIGEDLADARTSGKRLAIVFEQAGCSYCKKMHETVLSDPKVIDYLKEHFVIVQYNLFGDEEVTDLDGDVLTEKTAAEKWNILFTPTWIFLPEEADGSTDAINAAVGTMPGFFGKSTFLDLFTWVYDKGYDGDEAFQRYHNRMILERQAAAGVETKPAQ
ncbi:MAG: thioredoxin fold domain-containing protein [Granulosicoccus sp.]|nr:thioredoxin fold domain-containing protein [Granulosicoccus sp.]